jgi:hypothetical protein
MGVIRAIIIFLFVLTVIELSGYYFISDTMLVGEVVKHYKPADLVATTENINVYSNYQLDESQKKHYTDVYKRGGVQQRNIRFFTDAFTFGNHIDLEDSYNYVLDVHFNAVPFAVVEEGENTTGQTAIWQSKYLWCLYKWVLIKKERPAGPSRPDEPSLQAIGI